MFSIGGHTLGCPSCGAPMAKMHNIRIGSSFADMTGRVVFACGHDMEVKEVGAEPIHHVPCPRAKEIEVCDVR